MIATWSKPSPSSPARIAATMPSTMPDGAMMSAPACGMHDRGARQQLERRVVEQIALRQMRRGSARRRAG